MAPVNIHPVILSGGSGTRLWPMSRRLLPKQFLPLVTTRTMLQETVARLEGLPDCASPIVVSNHEHRFLVAEQLNELGVRPAVQILEPVGRNTAPAVATAARIAAQDLLVTFGIQPTEPNTGYGYIEVGERLRAEQDGFGIRRFVEKPDASRAAEYVASGRFLWNSGM